MFDSARTTNSRLLTNFSPHGLQLIVLLQWISLVFGGISSKDVWAASDYIIIIGSPIVYYASTIALVDTAKLLKVGLPLIIYLVTSIISAIYRVEAGSYLLHFATLVTLILAFCSNVKLSLKFLNLLFIASVISSIAGFHLGTNEYGYIPGSGIDAVFGTGLSSRISLFPHATPPIGALFASIVFLANIFYNKNKNSLIIFALLSMYFLVFSGSRSVMFGFLYGLTAMFSIHYFRSRHLLVFVPWMFVVIFFLLSILDFSIAVDGGQDLLGGYLDRAATLNSDSESVGRWLIWLNYFEIFLTAPIFGAGSEASIVVNAVLGTEYTESILTKMLARDGLMVILFIVFCHRYIVYSINIGNSFGYSLFPAFMLLMASYSSMLTFSTFIYSIMIFAFNGLSDTLVRFRSPSERSIHLLDEGMIK